MWARLKDIGVYALAVLALLVGYTAMAIMYYAFWLLFDGLGGIAWITGIPTRGGAPEIIHLINFVLQVWPGVALGWLVLRFASKRQARFGRTMLGLSWLTALAFVFGVLLAPWAVRSWLVDDQHMYFVGFALSLILGYIWTDRVIYKVPLSAVTK